MSADAYQLMPLKPESTDSMKARFSAALCQIPTPPTRPHTFDFDSNIRMIASLEVGLPVGPLIHLSFGVPPWNRTLSGPAQLQRLARSIAVQLVGMREEEDAFQSDKAFHLFFKQ